MADWSCFHHAEHALDISQIIGITYRGKAKYLIGVILDPVLAVFAFSKMAKNWFLAIFEIANNNGFWSKKFFHEIDLFDFTTFLVWTI